MKFPRSFDELLGLCAFTATDRQSHLAAVHGKQKWEVDLDAGEIVFRGRHRYRVQILGSESEVSNTWLWAWDNTESELPEKLLRASRQLRQIGQKHHISRLTKPQVDLDKASGHELAMIGCVLLDGIAYYRAPYEDGAVFLLLTEPALPVDKRSPSQRFQESLDGVLQTFDLPIHRLGLQDFLTRLKLAVHQTPTTWTVGVPPRQWVLTFDAEGRVVRIKTSKGIS